MDEETRNRELMASLRKSTAALEKTEHGVAALRVMVETLVEILIARGVLVEGHARLLGKLRARAREAFGQRVRLRGPIDKYAIADAGIDCQERLHLCHARCCAFSVQMTAQDLEEGGIAWHLDEPYMLRREEDGFCTHLDRDGAGCVIYDRRPAGCREFDCREDRRVWIDFERMQPAPMPEGLAPLPCTERDRGR